MPVVQMREILDHAFAERYGVAAINVVDDLSLEAVLAAATELEAPLIVQTSLKTVKAFGAARAATRSGAPAPTTCRSRSRCTSTTAPSASGSRSAWRRAGTGSCSTAPSSTSRRTRARRSRSSPRPRRYGAQVEGEIESVLGVEDGVGSDEAGEVHPVDISGEFIAATGVYSFAPAIGTAHGLYKAAPKLMPERVTEMVEQHPIPMVLHGGTGSARTQFTDLIARGCAKVNISTALKIALVDATASTSRPTPASTIRPRCSRRCGRRSRTWRRGTSRSSGRRRNKPRGRPR